MTSPQPTAAERFAAWASALKPDDIPDPVRRVLRRALLDSCGLMVAARNEDYIHATVAASDGDGRSKGLEGYPADSAGDGVPDYLDRD